MLRPFIMVATPCFGRMVHQGYMLSVLQMLQQSDLYGFDMDVVTLGGDALISRARSTLVAHFLNHPRATHLLFIDADISFECGQAARLLRFDREFCAGLYPLKEIDWRAFPLRVAHGEAIEQAGLSYVGTPCEGPALRRERGFVTGTYAGTGFQMLRRSVFEKMIAAYPELRFKAIDASLADMPKGNFYAFFESIIHPEDGTYLSEDYSFCHRWRAIGGEIWLDTESKLTHTGNQIFAGDCTRRFAASWAQADHSRIDAA